MLVSVIIACHKKDPYLYKSLPSILSQTYKNIEVIFIANGDNSSEVKSYALQIANKDPRFFAYEAKIGQLSHALNFGIEKSRGNFIARMDADDISEPTRIEKQLDFLISNDYDIIGSSAYLINEHDIIIGERKSIASEKISKIHLVRCPLIHPSVLMRKNSLIKVKGYNSGLNSEDYDLWIRSIKSGLKIGNMPEKLIRYRIHSNSTQGSSLAYAEVSGYILRELLLSFSFKKFLFLLINIGKFYRNSFK